MARREEENKSLRRTCDRLQSHIRKTENELQESKDWAVVSGEALREIKAALSLPVDVVNKARLFDEQLEKEERLSQGHIIRFFGDQARKI